MAGVGLVCGAGEGGVDVFGYAGGVGVANGPEGGDDVLVAGELAGGGEVDRFVGESGAGTGGGAG